MDEVSETPKKRGPGRPRKDHPFGEMREDGPPARGRLKAWRPKKWRPEYERMVAMSCLGMSNKMIAHEVGYTKEHVSTILNMDEAETIRIMVLQKMRAQLVESDIPGQMDYIAQKTLKLIKTAVDDEELFKKSPFQLIDRGLEVVKGLGHFKAGQVGGGNVTVNTNGGNALVVTGEQADSLAAALERSNNVRALRAPAKEVVVDSNKPLVEVRKSLGEKL